MRTIKIKNHVLAVTGALFLGIATMGGNSASASLIDPTTQLDGIPPVGNPAFAFNRTGSDYSNTIQSWYENMLYIGRNADGQTYDFYATTRGDFGYWENADTRYQGTDGVFTLYARFGAAGWLQGGVVQMTGAINELGIYDPNAVLLTANLVRYSTDGVFAGFAIDNIICPRVEIINCQEDPGVAESVYLQLTSALPTIRNLGDQTYTTTVLANTTTVPVPASVWLMLSGLGLLFAHSRRRPNNAAA